MISLVKNNLSIIFVIKKSDMIIRLINNYLKEINFIEFCYSILLILILLRLML